MPEILKVCKPEPLSEILSLHVRLPNSGDEKFSSYLFIFFIAFFSHQSGPTFIS